MNEVSRAANPKHWTLFPAKEINRQAACGTTVLNGDALLHDCSIAWKCYINTGEKENTGLKDRYLASH